MLGEMRTKLSEVVARVRAMDRYYQEVIEVGIIFPFSSTCGICPGLVGGTSSHSQMQTFKRSVLVVLCFDSLFVLLKYNTSSYDDSY